MSLTLPVVHTARFTVLNTHGCLAERSLDTFDQDESRRLRLDDVVTAGRWTTTLFRQANKQHNARHNFHTTL